MADYGFSDYAIFDEGYGTVNNLKGSLSTNTDDINKCKSELNSEAVFMGPMCDSCVEGFDSTNAFLVSVTNNFDKIASYLTEISTAYKNGDENASKKILGIEGGVVETRTKTVITGDTTQDQIFNYLKNEGFNNAAIAGILANMEYESGFKTTVYGDGGTSYGLCQWHSGRFTNLRNYCSNNGLDYTSVEGQMSYLMYELKNSYPGVYNYIKNVPNTKQGAYDAAYKWTVSFEIPANKESSGAKRGNTAQSKYWEKYGDA